MDQGKSKGLTPQGKSWAQLREEAGWLGVLAVLLWLNAAYVLLAHGAIFSSLLRAMAGLMAWTPTFLDLRAQGKRTLSNGGRVATGLICFVISIAIYPADQDAPAQVAASPAQTQAAPVARTCGTTDRKTGLDIGVHEDGSQLRTLPDTEAKFLMTKVGDEQVPQTIDGSTLIREECRSGSWSRVRIISPNEFRDMAGWVPSADLVPIKTYPDGRRIYRSEDFTWDDGSTANRGAIVTALNTVIRQNPSCEAYDTAALLVSGASSNPTLDALCIGPQGEQHLVFALNDVKSGKVIKAAVQQEPSSEVTTTLTSSEANEQCQEATLTKLAHPSTADFNTWDTTFRQLGNETTFSIGLTAKNAFGTELKLLSTCVFVDNTLKLNHMEETR